MKIALASPSVATTIDDGLAKVNRLLTAAAAKGAAIVCFPEAYLPGLRGLDFEVPEWTHDDEQRALAAVAQWSRELRIATILGIELVTPSGRQIAAAVIDARGELQGFQTKNQLDPSEDRFYVPGETRRVFEV